MSASLAEEMSSIDVSIAPEVLRQLAEAEAARGSKEADSKKLEEQMVRQRRLIALERMMCDCRRSRCLI